MGSDRQVATKKQSWIERMLRGLLSVAVPQSQGTGPLDLLLLAGRELTGSGDAQVVANRLAALVVSHTSFTRVQVLLAGEGQRLYLAAAVDVPDWAQAEVERVLRSQEASLWQQLLVRGEVLISDRTVHVPLLVSDAGMGVLTVYPETWPVAQEQIKRLEMLVAQAAPWLHYSRSQAELESQRSQLVRITQCLQGATARLGASESDANRAVAAVVEAASRLFAPATVLLHTREGVQWHEAAGAASSPLDISSVAGGSHVLCLPLVCDGQQYGHLEVYLHGEQRRPSNEELAALHVLMHLLTFALGRADLLQRMNQGTGNQAEQAYLSTLEALSKALEMRAYETEGHSRRVVQYALALARTLGLPEPQLTPLMRGALLHDIGKIAIPDAVLRKPGPLNEEEWACMKEHPRIGHSLLSQIDFLAEAMPIILHHHERYDGSGYPLGLQADAIPLGARIFAVADAYEAITSDRPYRKGRSHHDAVGEIVRCAGNHFDPSVVHALMSTAPEEFAAIRAGKLLSLR